MLSCDISRSSLDWDKPFRTTSQRILIRKPVTCSIAFCAWVIFFSLSIFDRKISLENPKIIFPFCIFTVLLEFNNAAVSGDNCFAAFRISFQCCVTRSSFPLSGVNIEWFAGISFLTSSGIGGSFSDAWSADEAFAWGVVSLSFISSFGILLRIISPWLFSTFSFFVCFFSEFSFFF